MQDQGNLDLPMNLRKPFQIETLRPVNLGVHVADAHGQNVDPRGRDESRRLFRVGETSFPAAVARKARGKLAELGLDGNSAGMRQPGEEGDALDIALRPRRGIRWHDQVESERDGHPDPVVVRTFIEDDSAGNRGRLPGRPAKFPGHHT